MTSSVTSAVPWLLAASLLLPACAPTTANDDAKVVTDLRRLERLVKGIATGVDAVTLDADEAAAADSDFTIQDCMVLKATLTFGRTLSDHDLDTAFAYSMAPDGATSRWLLARVMVDHGRYDSAAELLVTDVEARPEKASTRVWTWWQEGFRRRADYSSMSLQFTDALLRQFVAQTASGKLAVARIFGKGEAEAALPIEPFKAAIGYENLSARLK
jgi:hypothetical protein